jgi:hypothetical protein
MKLLEEKEAKTKSSGSNPSHKPSSSSSSASSKRPTSALPPSEPKSDQFKFSVEHSKKSSSSSFGQRASRKMVETKIETEPLYRPQPSSVPRRESADEYLQSALKDYPKLFEIRGEKKDICSPPASPPKNEPKIPPKRPTSSYYRPVVPGAKLTQNDPETINLGENDSLPPTNRNSTNNTTNKVSMASGSNATKRRNSTGKLIFFLI